MQLMLSAGYYSNHQHSMYDGLSQAELTEVQ